MTRSELPKLSIVVTTWNNEEFIERCLHSILSQKVDFGLEILVGNDASTDRTAELVAGLSDQNPGIIQLIDRPKNVGTSENFVELVYRAQGTYIAQVDGDDALIDEQKFQLQVDFLDQHPECSICFHHYMNQNAKGMPLKPSEPPFTQDTITDIGLLFQKTLGPGNTTVFRKDALPPVAPKWLRNCANHKDFAMQFLVASKGKIGYLNRVMSAYTIHENNITKTESLEKLLVQSLIINEGFLNYHQQLGLTEHEQTLKYVINQRLWRLTFFYLDKKRYLKFIGSLFNSLILHQHWTLQMIKDSLYETSPQLFSKFKRMVPRFIAG